MTRLPESTLDGLESTAGDVRGLWVRRFFLALLSLVLVAGLLGLLGVRSTTSEGAADGWTLSLEHAAVARAGLDVPFTATVTHDGGFDEKVTLAVTGDYFDLYETQGFNPVPSETSRDGELFYLTFDAPPEGDTLGGDVRRLHPAGRPTGQGRHGQRDRRRAARRERRLRDEAVAVSPTAVRGGVMEIVIRAVVVFAFLWIVTRAVGRATLGELSTFELLLYVTMGDLVQQGVTQQDSSVTGAVIAVGTFAILTVAMSWVQFRFPRSRDVITGRPVLVLADGKPDEGVLRRQRLAIADLLAAAREQGIRRTADIEYAVLEANGKISFFTYEGEEQSGAPEKPPQN